jgi:hypothetical protein
MTNLLIAFDAYCNAHAHRRRAPVSSTAGDGAVTAPAALRREDVVRRTSDAVAACGVTASVNETKHSVLAEHWLLACSPMKAAEMDAGSVCEQSREMNGNNTGFGHNGR